MSDKTSSATSGVTNAAWSRTILEDLASAGVRDVIFCAGARNSPLIAALDKCDGFRALSFFEERSAAFYALGVSRRENRPVAIITTSGTAAAELLPATIEAFHTGVPLVLVTADRPRRLRGTGAPQAIDQVGLYAKFVAQEFDLELGGRADLSSWTKRAPLHLNICFDEPLLDAKFEEFSIANGTFEGFKGRSSTSATSGREWASLKLTKFFRGRGPLLVLVGSLETHEEMKAAENFLSLLGAPVYAEGTSGLRESRVLDSVMLKSGDKILPLALRKGWVKRVLRIGGVPTARIWRDLEDAHSPAEVFSLSPLPFAGLSRGEFVCAEIASTLSAASSSVTTLSTGDALTDGDRMLEKEFLARDAELHTKLEALFDAEPMSEPSLVRSLSRAFGPKDLFYVGNSLPVREWDLAADRTIARHAEANRGVNGIDGQISTFLGLIEQGSTGWALIGDLTAMYDLAGPWAAVESARTGAAIKFRLVVLNNSGGKIFHRIFRRQIFENQHDFDFQKWAEQWRLAYEKWTSVPESWTSNSDQVVIELVPDNSATERFYDRYDALFV